MYKYTQVKSSNLLRQFMLFGVKILSETKFVSDVCLYKQIFIQKIKIVLLINVLLKCNI
jgi:hypothetical protein